MLTIRCKLFLRQINEPAMDFPGLPADAALSAWQILCCAATLITAMLSCILVPR